jgi:pentatricopeptide repeat protein
LQQRILTLGDNDPFVAFDLLCGTYGRVVREKGPRSLEAARWTQAMATPLIAYLNQFDAADRLLQFARPILEHKLGAFSPEVAELHVANAWMSFRRGQLTEAADAWSRALAIREKVPGPRQIELQKVLVGLAQVRMSERRFTEADKLTERGYGILRANGETISEAAAALKNLQANIALNSEDFAAARDHAREQVAIELALRAKGGPDQPVTAYLMLGQALQRLNQYAEAEAAMREAVRWSESQEGPLQRGALTAYTQLSALLNDRGEPQQAAQFAQQALARGERELGKDAPNLVPALYSLAQAERTLGDLAQALHLYQRAAAIVEKNAATVQPSFAVRHYRGYAQLLLQIGDQEGALREIVAAENLSRGDPTLSTERAAVLLLLSAADRSLDAAKARGYLQDAVQIYQTKLTATHPQTLRALNELCTLDLLSAVPGAPACDEVAARLTDARYADPQIRQAVLQNLSERASGQGDSARMRRLALESLAAAQTLAAPDSRWRANFQVARSLYVTNEPALAIFFAKQAVDELQILRRSLQSEDARLDSAFLRDKVSVYRTLANWLMDQGRLDEALEVLDLMKSEELAEFLRGSERDATAGRSLSRSVAEQALAQRYQSLLSGDESLGSEMAELTRLRRLDRISAAERARLEAFLAKQRNIEAQRAEQLDAFLQSDSPAVAPRTASERTVRAMRLDRDLRQFGRGTALAIYVLADDQLRILIATPERQIERRQAINSADLRRAIGDLLDDVAAKRNVLARSQHLYDLLLRPVAQAAKAAGARRIVLWPDGALRYVPFALLHDGAGFASDNFELQLYSDVAATGQQAPRRDKPLSVRGLGVTQAIAGFAALPGVAEELCGIVHGPIAGLSGEHADCVSSGAAAGAMTGQGAIPGAGFADASFTQQQFDALLAGPRDFSVLHISTHFSLRPGNALRSYLLTGSGERMTLDRLAAIDFAGVQLITLSACQTALGGAVTGDGREIEGLSSLVQKRGVERVVASLWRVEDRSTAVLMKSFYRRLAESPGNDARALRLAQLDLRRLTVDGRRPYEHPFYWAGFTLDSARP